MRHALVGILCAMLASPLAGGSDVIGVVAGGRDFSVGGLAARAGTTVFSGDVLQVGDPGEGAVAVPGGSRLGLGPNSRGRLARAKPGAAATLEPDTGSFVLASLEKAPIEVVVGDAAFRSSSKELAVAFVEFTDATHVTFGAKQGDWVMTGGPENKTVILHPPTGAKMVLDPQGPQGTDAVGARRRRIVFITIAVVAAAAITAAGIEANVGHKKPAAVSVSVP